MAGPFERRPSQHAGRKLHPHLARSAPPTGLGVSTMTKSPGFKSDYMQKQQKSLVAKKGSAKVESAVPGMIAKALYTVALSAAVAWLLQGSATIQALKGVTSASDLSAAASVALGEIEAFRWTTGVTKGTSWGFLVKAHVVYASLLYCAMKYMESKDSRLSFVVPLRRLHNIVMAALSAFMLGGLLFGGYRASRFQSWDNFVCQKPYVDGLVQWTMYTFYLSKMMEFVDTFLLVFGKKKVIFLHKVHHLTTMSLVWHAQKVGLSSEILCGGTNCFVHTIMYAYFAFPEGVRFLRPYMTSTQIIQFVMCLTGLGYAAGLRALGRETCTGTSAAEIHGLFMYGVYLAMFAYFFHINYLKNAKKAREAKEADSKKKRVPEHEVIIDGKRVDVTAWYKRHPGGTKVLRIFKDRDATEQFNAYHSTYAHKVMKALPSRKALSNDKLVMETEIAKDFAKMDAEFRKKGYYQADWPEEILKLGLVFGPVIYGYYLLWNGQPMLGSCLVGFGYYYSGWVSHDYLHHAVFKGGSNRDETTRTAVWWNNLVGSFLGTVQGYEVAWWRARHNTHHVVTNEDGNDPDIRTAPVLTYIRGNATLAKGLNWVQRWQEWYYLPVMCILDYYWRLESIMYIAMRMPKYTRQALQLSLHYIFLAWAFQGQYSYIAVMSLFRGFLTGVVVFSTHYGEDLLEKNPKMTLVRQTALTSRNITGGYLANLLTGFISLQTEHHLFPMMPTGSLSKIQPAVRAFFKKHKLEYREGNIFECVWQNIRALRYEGEQRA